MKRTFLLDNGAPGRGEQRRCHVTERHPDGRTTPLGFIALKHFRHVRQTAWEVTGLDGHRGVHEHHWQAVWALTWDGTGNPFPVISKQVRDWTINGL